MSAPSSPEPAAGAAPPLLLDLCTAKLIEAVGEMLARSVTRPIVEQMKRSTDEICRPLDYISVEISSIGLNLDGIRNEIRDLTTLQIDDIIGDATEFTTTKLTEMNEHLVRIAASLEDVAVAKRQKM